MKYSILVSRAVLRVSPRRSLSPAHRSLSQPLTRLPRSNDAHRLEELIEQAGILQNGHPGVGAQQEVHPHGEHDEDHGDPLKAGALLGHDVGQRIPDEQADEGGDQGQLEGADEHHPVGAHLGEVIQGKAAPRAGEGVDDHQENGGDHEEGHPDHIGAGQKGEPILHRLPPAPPRRQDHSPRR